MLDIVAIGEAMFEFSQLPNSSGHWLEGFGGDTLNMLIAAQRAGARTGFLSALGDDEFGDSIFSLMTREAVDCQAVERSACAPTGIYFIHHDHEGHRFSYRRKGSAASQMQANRWLHAPASRWLYASGISQAIGPGCRALVLEAFTNAQAGCQRAYDLNFRSKLWTAEHAHQALVELAPFIDVLLPSLDDVGALAKQPDISIEDALHWLDQFNIREVVLRCGAKGAVLIEPKGANDRVRLGTTVTVDMGGKRETYRLLGSAETNPLAGIISDSSPLGAALLGKGIGDTVSVRRGDANVVCTVITIE